MPITINERYGRYTPNVDIFIRFVNIVNVRSNNPPPDKEKCECAIDIPGDYKKLTKDDYKKIATNKYSVDFYDLVFSLAVAAGRTEIADPKKPAGPDNVKPTADALKAQNALADLRPEGSKDWAEFGNMVIQVYTENFKDISKARIEFRAWYTENLVNRLTENKITKLTRANLTQLTKTYDGVQLFEQAYAIKEYGKEQAKNKETGLPEFTKAALYAQEMLAKFAPDSKAEPALYAKYKDPKYKDKGDIAYLVVSDMISTIEASTRKSRDKIVEEGRKKEKDAQKAAKKGKLIATTDFSALELGTHGWTQDVAINRVNDQRSASDLLIDSGVVANASSEQLPALVRSAKAAAVSLAA